jgi:large subunit ribosomal protein L15
VEAMKDPQLFFTKGLPIPRCKLPPENLVEYYSNPANRGYLANPEEILKLRLQLAQKYGYELINVTDPKQKEMLLRRKDTRQIWYGSGAGLAGQLGSKVHIEAH